MVAAECGTSDVLGVLDEVGIMPEPKALQGFLTLYQELNNNTRKFANCGFTPNELFSKGKQERDKKNEDQISLF